MMSMQRRNACPCCRAPLVESQAENEDSEYEESVDEEGEDDDESSDDDSSNGEPDDNDVAPIENILDRLEKNGYTMKDIASMYLYNFSKIDPKYTPDHIDGLYKTFDMLVLDVTSEMKEARLFAAEDFRA